MRERLTPSRNQDADEDRRRTAAGEEEKHLGRRFLVEAEEEEGGTVGKRPFQLVPGRTT